MAQINQNNLILKAENLQTPCFIFNEAEFFRSVKGFQQALIQTNGKGVVGYSVKTNSLPYMLSMACALDCYAEVVSYDEYALAQACGFEKNKIVYNGPMKSKETFLDAIKHGAIVNIETKRELEWLYELPKDKTFNVGIRLSINISKVSPEDADGDDDFSRFGFSNDTDEFELALNKIRTLPNVKLNGLHIHRTTHSRSVVFYERSIAYAAKVIHKYNLQLDYLDVGGGYFGIFPNKPTYQVYCEAITKACKTHGLENLLLIVEPGNAIQASALAFLTEVIDVKQIKPELYNVATDGSRNDVDPFFKKRSYLMEIQRLDNNGPIVAHQIISGCTCLEYDQLTELHNQPLLRLGDRVRYNNVGAYTMCLSPLFIRLFPRVYAQCGDEYTEVREAWSVKELMQNSNLYSK